MSHQVALFLVVIGCFSLIHFVEVSSFLARLSGVKSGDSALAYAVQSAVFMVTRFFSMLLLPVLGLIIDLQVSRADYLLAICCAIGGALILSSIALTLRGRIVGGFLTVISDVKRGGSLFSSLLKLPVRCANIQPVPVDLKPIKYYVKHRIFWLSAIVFAIYATSLFIAFYLGLIFHEYRTAISQMSAVTNAFAAVLLTFYVEPAISVSIDSGIEPVDKIFTMLIGRVFGIGFLALLPIAAFWFSA